MREEHEALEQAGLARLLLRARDREIGGRVRVLERVGVRDPQDDRDHGLGPGQDDVAAHEHREPLKRPGERGGRRASEQGLEVAALGDRVGGVPARRHALKRLQDRDRARHAREALNDRGHVPSAHLVGVRPEDDPTAAQLGQYGGARRRGGSRDRADRGNADAPENLGALLAFNDHDRGRQAIEPLDAVQRQVDDRHAPEARRPVGPSPAEALRSVRAVVALVDGNEGARGVVQLVDERALGAVDCGRSGLPPPAHRGRSRRKSSTGSSRSTWSETCRPARAAGVRPSSVPTLTKKATSRSPRGVGVASPGNRNGQRTRLDAALLAGSLIGSFGAAP